MTSCSLLVIRCSDPDCKQEFIGGWGEWYCPSCKKKRNYASNAYYKHKKKMMEEQGC